MTTKNIRLVPKHLLDRINSYADDSVVVASVRTVHPEATAKFAHLGISVENGQVKTAPPFIPDPKAGRYSRANVFGYSRALRDQPKIPKSFDMDAPSWNGSGYHTVSHTRMVYPREEFAPKSVTLHASVLQVRPEGAVVRFAIQEALRRTSPDFERELFYNLNILQENLGYIDVIRSGAELAELIPSTRVHWEFLPTDSIDEIVSRLTVAAEKGEAGSINLAEVRKRLNVLKSLKPKDLIIGSSSFTRYIGARIRDDLVVFENPSYGNAVYVMYEDWEALSRRSRLDLLRNGDQHRFDRIPHKDGWDDRLRRLVARS